MLALGVAVLVAGCDFTDNTSVGRGTLIAEVGEQRLYAQDIGDQLGATTGSADSLARLRELANTWARTAALAEEARVALEGDVELERLVADYRQSLQLDRYQQELFDSSSQPDATEAELDAMYQQAGAAINLSVPIVRATLIKVRQPVPDKAAFESAWYSTSGEENFTQVEAFAKTHANLALTDREQWHNLDAITALLPHKAIGSFQPGTRVAQRDGFSYYLRILERKERGQPAPLAYVRPQLLAAARQRQRATFLAERAEASYRAARQRDAVKIYVNE